MGKEGIACSTAEPPPLRHTPAPCVCACPPPPPRVRRARKEGKNPKSCDEVFERLITEGVDPDDLYHEVTHQVGVKGQGAQGGARGSRGGEARGGRGRGRSGRCAGAVS
jgi:hypothetical protein